MDKYAHNSDEWKAGYRAALIDASQRLHGSGAFNCGSHRGYEYPEELVDGMQEQVARQWERELGRSKCCGAFVRSINGVEGTSYYVCEKCGRPADSAPAAGEREPDEREEKPEVWVLGGRTMHRWERSAPSVDPSPNTGNPPRMVTHAGIASILDEYHAVNLREALKLVPDTGDWHGSLRIGCEIVLRDKPDARPNQTAEQMRSAPSVEITDEMVERAAEALADPPDRKIDWQPHYPEFSEELKDCYRRPARRVLSAALNTEGQDV